ncbi:TANK-binding kinase 1-binding protein 1-like [Papaver somniferum]|uniref:TANK-binding kinase 1-binding protein 1-like n=1 Tax=Papaver somniferum TaxID=3469 RepID=UPI000E6FD575|nr:TANK-binding kinase 1-binding protein 1-like [Papaver somniferum]
MAEFSSLQCSVMGFSVGFLLLSIVLVYASSTDQNIAEVSLLSSLEMAPIKEASICKPGDSYKETTFSDTLECFECYNWCIRFCGWEMQSRAVRQICKPISDTYSVFCQCCCEKIPYSPPPLPFPPLPSPPSPSPSPSPSPPPLPFPPRPSPTSASPPPPPFQSPPPPPPSSPPPTPKGDTCDKPGDSYSETTYPTSDCTYCKDWCKDECSDLGGEVVSNKCSIGESKFVRRCKCCCHENPVPRPPPPPSCPTLGCPMDLTVTLPGLGSCKYKLVSLTSRLALAM